MAPGTNLYGPANLQIIPVDIASPLLTGVKSLDGGNFSYREKGYLTPSAPLVANWSDQVCIPS